MRRKRKNIINVINLPELNPLSLFTVVLLFQFVIFFFCSSTNDYEFISFHFYMAKKYESYQIFPPLKILLYVIFVGKGVRGKKPVNHNNKISVSVYLYTNALPPLALSIAFFIFLLLYYFSFTINSLDQSSHRQMNFYNSEKNFLNCCIVS